MKATVPSLPNENGVPVKINVILLRFPQANLFLQIVLPVKKLKHLSRKAQKVRVSGWKGIRTNTPLSPKIHRYHWNHKYSFVDKIHHCLSCTSWLQNPTSLVRE